MLLLARFPRSSQSAGMFKLTGILLLAWLGAFAAPNREIPSPAGPGAVGAAFATAPDGTVYLSWLEPAGGEAWALKFSRYDPARRGWEAARLIDRGEDWFINWADFPQLAISRDGRLTAVWFVNNPAHHAMAMTDEAGHHGPGYRAIYSQSADGGLTWSPTLPVSDEAIPTEFAALQPLADGRVLAAWLDGRARARGQDRQTLYARVLGASGPDVLVDDRVCDCCQLSFIPEDDGALLVYRARTADEVRDMRIVRFDGQRWHPPAPLHDDGWKIAACPVNGARLAAHPGRTVAVWFTAAADRARVLAAGAAPDGRFAAPTRLDLGRPQGRVDCLALPDGTTLATWLEHTGPEQGTVAGIYARLIRPDGSVSPAVILAASTTARAGGFPRLARAHDGNLLLAYTIDGEPSRVATLLLSPETLSLSP
jgi:hypothetical protein